MLNYWEEFDGTPFIPSHKRAHVTLNWKGVFYINENLYQQMGRPQAVAFFFNRAESVIGISKAAPDRRNAFHVRHNAGGYYISAMPVLRRYNIKLDLNTTLQFEAPYIDNEGLLRLDIRKTAEVPKRDFKPRVNRGKTAAG